MSQPQPQPRTALPPLPAAAPRIARRLPASAATRGGAEPRGAEPGGDHLPGTVQGGTRWRGRRGSPLSSHLLPAALPRPGGAPGRHRQRPPLRSAPHPDGLRSAPQRSAPRSLSRCGSAAGPSAPAAPRPAWGGSVGPGRGQPCPVLPGDARGCSVLPGAAHRARASRCYPVPPGAARVLPGDARGCPVLPTLLRPPCPSSPAMPPQLSTALGAAAPSQKSSRPGRAGFLLL